MKTRLLKLLAPTLFLLGLVAISYVTYSDVRHAQQDIAQLQSAEHAGPATGFMGPGFLGGAPSATSLAGTGIVASAGKINSGRFYHDSGSYYTTGSTASLTSVSLTNLTAYGTLTRRDPTGASIASSQVMVGAVSASTGGSVAGWAKSTSNAIPSFARVNGFTWDVRWEVNDAVATANMFVGFRFASSTLTDVAPSTLTNLFGVGTDSGDTALQLYSAGSSAEPRTSLGIAVAVGHLYDLKLTMPPGGASVSYVLTDMTSGTSASGTVTSNVPVANRGDLDMWRSNGGTASAVEIQFVKFYAEW